ncbi:MAG: hypothetical protein HZB66_01565 [Candidatus Aenigmarchaeota archaeon]|nr:hypothetical protein [Candidatus Aenigmarchaeota archaeon]
MEITNEDFISIFEAKKILEERQKQKDLVYEQKICLELLNKIGNIPESRLKAMKEELEKITILKSRHIAIIINAMPDTEEEVEVLFSKERTNLKKEEIKQVAEIVKKYK